MLCSEACMVNHGWDGIQAVSLRCRSWGCPICHEARKSQLVALAKAGQPNTFITLTVNPAIAASPYERARLLADAWRQVVRLVKAKYGYKKLPYLCVFEATKNGEPHLHILARVKWISQKWLSETMACLIMAPIVDIRRVRDLKKLTYYISKYIGKDPHRFESCKRYWSTRDYELTKYEPEKPAGRWGKRWKIVRCTLDELVEMWRGEGREVEQTRHRAVAFSQGPPDDEVTQACYLLRRREQGLPW